MTETTMSWAMLVGLGAFHGINPGMGWLFAVALGLQEHSRRAVLRALVPLGAGHAMAVAAAIAAATALGAVVPLAWVRWPAGVLLAALGVSRVFRHAHPRWAHMRVGFTGLTWWAFLMASAHGAGLMVVPVFLGMTAVHAEGASCHMAAASNGAGAWAAVIATALHASGYLAVTAVVALTVFEKFGVGLLRRAWVNLDLVWAAALIVTGVLTVAW